MKRSGTKCREEEIEITEGTTNVFADLGYPDAVERQTKVRLAIPLLDIVKARKLKQRELAKILDIPQPKVSALVNARLDGFSVEKLIEFLTSLNRDVDIVIRPRPAKRGAGRITVLSR
jgi:predicted XRE-type DNA-binding protein